MKLPWKESLCTVVYESNGEKKYMTEINVNDLVMLGGRNKNQ
jgi:hypothetical protein